MNQLTLWLFSDRSLRTFLNSSERLSECGNLISEQFVIKDQLPLKKEKKLGPLS